MVNSMTRYFLYFLLTTFYTVGLSQTNVDFKQMHAGGDKSLRSGIALSPNGEKIAIAGMKGEPLFIYDWKKDQILEKFHVGNWHGGSKVSFSQKGNYILLQKIHYINLASKKDRKIDFEIVASDHGKVIKRFLGVQAVKIADSETFCIVLDNDEISFYELPSGKKTNHFIVENATNSLAISPDETTIAISHRPTLTQIKNSGTIRNDKKSKKAINPALKYQQMVSLYDVNTFQKTQTVHELYNIVYHLQFSEDGSRLFNYNIPHSKIQTSSAGNQGAIDCIKMPDGTPLRTSFGTLSLYPPDFKENNQTFFGVVSTDVAPQINIHDYQTGKMLARFDTRQRLFDGIKKKMYGNNKASFIFLPNESILIVTGNQTIIWTPKLNY